MATKFYRAAGEQSDDDDDDRSDAGDGSDDDKPKVAATTTAAAKPAAGAAKPATAKATAVPKKSGGLFGDKKLNVGSDDDEDDDDDQKRKVVSAKEKKMSALLAAIKAMRNALKIGNWVKVLAEWEAIDKHLEKLMKEPEFRKEGVPKVYWQQLLGVDAIIRKQKEDEKKAKAGDDDAADAKSPAAKAAAPKKISADQARAQTRLHSNLKKLIKQYEKQLTEYKKAPLPEDASVDASGDAKKPAADDDEDGDEDGDGDEDDDGDADDDDSADVKGMKTSGGKGSSSGGKAVTASGAGGAGAAPEDDDDEEWDEDSDEDTADVVDLSKGTGKQFTREYWMKKPGAPDSDDEELKVKKPKEKRKQGVGKAKTDADLPGADDEKKKKDAKPEVDFTPEVIMKRLTELVAMRGRRGTDRQLVISDLKLLSTKTQEPAPLLKVYISLCSALFDVTLNADTHMPIPLWHQANETLLSIIKILMKESLVRLSEDDTAVEESFETGENEDQKIIEKYITTANAAKVEEEAKKKADEEKSLKAQGKEMQYVMGNLYSFVDRMAAEFKRSLQNLDPHAPEYVTRLKDEPVLLNLIERVQEYYFKIAKVTYQCKVVLLRLEHLYYHYQPTADAQRADAQAYVAALKAGKAGATPTASSSAGTPVSRTPFGASGFLNMENPAAVQQLATFLYKHADDRTRMRALLYNVYYLSIHNRYAEARDLLLMSHVQDGINEVDIYTRIIFNRTMAQLGMCAFRVGEYRHALYCLMDLHQSKSIKELIAQGTSSRYYGERDADKEKLERKRVYPYHQHMSLDMLESIHLLSAMLIEVPNFALYGADNKRKLVSKTFRRLFEHHQRQAFNGPPENTRDLIMGSAKALRAGDWSKALKYVMRLKMWELLPNAEYIKSMVTDKLKEEALRTYLCTFATQYVTISLNHLKTTFELADNVVYRITSKMMVNEQLQGTWDQPSACIVMHAQEPTPLQRAALKYADKASLFLEQNERAGEQRAALGSGDGTGERRSGYGGYGSGYQRAGGDAEGGDHPTGRRPYRGGRGGGRLGPGSRMRGGRGGGGGGGGGGDRHNTSTAAGDD